MRRSSAEPLRSAPAPALAPLPNRAVWPVQSFQPQVVRTRRQLQGELRAMLYGVRCTSSVCLGTPPSAGGEDTAAAAGGAAGSRPRSCDPLQRRAPRATPERPGQHAPHCHPLQRRATPPLCTAAHFGHHVWPGLAWTATPGPRGVRRASWRVWRSRSGKP